MFDLILKGGEVFDGTGAKGFTGDVGIKDGMITEVAPDIPTEGAAEHSTKKWK